MYDVVKDIIIPTIGIVVTIVIAVYTNRIAVEANRINEKSEPLIYHIVESNGEGKYNIDYDGEELEIPCKAHGIKVEQGVVDEIRIITYDGNNFSIYGQLDYDFMEQFRTNDYTMEIETGINLTQVYNGKVYDYFFIYIKAGDGTERVDLAYTGIDVINRKPGNPIIENKILTLKVNDKNKEDLAYYEMIEVYRDLQDKFSELLKSDK